MFAYHLPRLPHPTTNFCISTTTNAINSTTSLSSLYRTAVQVLIGTRIFHPQEPTIQTPRPLIPPISTPANPQKCPTTSPKKTSAKAPYIHTPPGPLPASTKLTPLPESPQNPHHAHLAQSAIARKSLPRADRARQVQGPARQGPRAAADQGLEGHDEEDAVWGGQ